MGSLGATPKQQGHRETGPVPAPGRQGTPSEVPGGRSSTALTSVPPSERTPSTGRARRKRDRLGDILVDTETITEEQLDAALRLEQQSGIRLGEALTKLDFVTEERLKKALAYQHDVTFVDLDTIAIDDQVASLMTKAAALKHRVIPVARRGDTLTVALDDPTAIRVIDLLEVATGYSIRILTSTHVAFERALSRAYDGTTDEAALDSDASGTRRPTHEELPREHESYAEHMSLLELRNEHNTRTLEELRVAHTAMRLEFEATASALRELAERHAALLQERGSAAASVQALLDRLRGSS